jgi:hypothetical protein
MSSLTGLVLLVGSLLRIALGVAHFSSYAFTYKCIDDSGLVCPKAFNGNKSV